MPWVTGNTGSASSLHYDHIDIDRLFCSPFSSATGDASSSTVQIETLPCTKFNSICQANVILTRRLEPGRYYDFQVSVKDTKGGMSVQSCSITATNFTTPHDVIFPHKAGIIMVPEVGRENRAALRNVGFGHKEYTAGTGAVSPPIKRRSMWLFLAVPISNAHG